MIERRTFVARLAGLVAGGFGGSRLWAGLPHLSGKPIPITIYKSSTCECCTKWVDYLKTSGFTPLVHDEENMDALKDEMGVPRAVWSCHTAMVEKYLIEGHVPASDIRRLLVERPRTAGLAVPGMPPRTYGMAAPGVEVGGYETVAFQLDGATRVFARH